jgi:hypothetical protein
LALFVLEPIAVRADWSFLPRVVAHYATKAYGSTFTPLPWVGYTLIGGVIGWHINRDTALYRTGWWPVFFLISGWILHAYSSAALLLLHAWSGWEIFQLMAINNYLLIRLGHVLIVIALFIWFEVIFKRFPKLWLKIGGETLLIYEAHYVLLYGSWFGIGIAKFGKYSLSPWACAAGALAFVLCFVLLVSRLDAIRAFWRRQVVNRLRRQVRLLRVWLLRTGPIWLHHLSRQVLALREQLRRRRAAADHE